VEKPRSQTCGLRRDFPDFFDFSTFSVR